MRPLKSAHFPIGYFDKVDGICPQPTKVRKKTSDLPTRTITSEDFNLTHGSFDFDQYVKSGEAIGSTGISINAIGNDMTLLKTLVAFAFTAALLGCSPPDHYPVSGQECTEKDPVKDLDAADCTVPGV